MSAERSLEYKITNPGQTTLQCMGVWGMWLREKPTVRMTKTELLAALESDTLIGEVVKELRRRIPEGYNVWVTEAEWGVTGDTTTASFTVRY
jgi:hypothetical protein